MSQLDMKHEPLRLGALAFLVVVVLLALLISVVQGMELKDAITLVLAVAGVGSVPVLAAEVKRPFTDSPATIENEMVEARQRAQKQLAGDTQFSAALPENPHLFGENPGPIGEDGKPVPVEYINPEDIKES